MSSEQVIACLHANTRARRDYVSCADCGSVYPDSGWGIARCRWFASLEDARFYKQNGRLPALQSTPANLVTVPASELRAMREEIERLRQGYWDARAVMGFDNDGDPTPAALVSDMAHLMAGDAASMRRDYDEACAEADDARIKLSALLDGIEAKEKQLRGYHADVLMSPHVFADDLKAVREKANGPQGEWGSS